MKMVCLQQWCPLCRAVGGTSAYHQRENHRWHHYWEQKKARRCRSAALGPKPEDQLIKKNPTDLVSHWLYLCYQSDMKVFTYRCLEAPFHVKVRFLFQAAQITNKSVWPWYSPHMTSIFNKLNPTSIPSALELSSLAPTAQTCSSQPEWHDGLQPDHKDTKS